MEPLNKIVTFLNAYLGIASFQDRSWNGVQVEGKPSVRKIVTAVDADMRTFQAAADAGADMLIVHHGHFWSQADPAVRGWAKRRITFLLDHGISLYAAHLPLDRHQLVGNNALLLKLLGAQRSGPFLSYEGQTISWRGRLARPVRAPQLARLLERKLHTTCKLLDYGPRPVRTVAVCSGGGGYGGFFAAQEAGVDLYVTGDAIEINAWAADIGINVIFAGHHATETPGVRALAALLGRRFAVETCFVDIPTGL